MNNIVNGKFRKHITVLFADIVKSSDIVRNYDPEIAENIFNEIITEQINIVKKFKGTVNQVMGDGLMCLFGVEDIFEEHAFRAVSAGNEMLEAIKVIQKKYKNIPLKIRIGVNTGEAILTKQKNSSYHAEYQATGEVVHMTDRVLKKATPNQMLISSPSREFLKKYYDFKETETLNWDRSKEPTILYTLENLKKLKNIIKVKLTKKHLVRQNIKKEIKNILTTTQKNKAPKIIWLYGSSGMGKTQIVDNFLSKYCNIHFDNTIQLNFYPIPLSTNSSFGYMILEELFGKNKKTLLKKIKQEVCFKNKKAPIFIKDCIKEILQIDELNSSYEGLDTSIKTRMQTETLAYIILSLTENKKILLIMEDLHWAKEQSIQFIEKLINTYQGHEHLFIVATSKNKPPFDRVTSESKIKNIHLEPMSQKESLELLGNIDTQRSLTLTISKNIYKLSGGNPYFMHEYFNWTQSLLSQNVNINSIKKKLANYTPNQIKDILYNKLSSMRKETIHVARISSTLGLKINFDILLAILNIDKSLLKNTLQELEAKGIIKQDKTLPSPEWVFTHELLQKVIYNSNPNSIKQKIHTEVINQLKKPEFKHMDDRHMIMATHAKMADNLLLHYIYSKWAAKKAYSQSQHQSCIKLSKNSGKILKKLKFKRISKKHSFELKTLEINSLFILGKYYLAHRKINTLLDKKKSF